MPSGIGSKAIFGVGQDPKPYKFIGFGDNHGPKPYKAKIVPSMTYRDKKQNYCDDFSLVFLCWPGRPGRGAAARSGRAGPKIPTPGRGPRKILADGTDSKFVKFYF